ncbi:dicer-like protein 4 [Carica papaya]|uniref:dicer-like protein 4 n=1 Tax=Carica papaya TaxID=3649 RepID=UPI000B8C7BD5|nr:dicer-like protein 4 [Carica papaya]
MTYYSKLEEIKRQCLSTLNRKTDDPQNIRNMKKMLIRVHANMVFCFESLGLWGVLEASRLLLTGDYCERKELIEGDGNFVDDSLSDRYLAQVAEAFASDCMAGGFSFDLSSVEVLKEPFFSRKLLRLIGILTSCRLQPNMKCIIFVNRIITAISLSNILQNLRLLASWKCHFLVGIHAGQKSMSRSTMNNILEKFQSGEVKCIAEEDALWRKTIVAKYDMDDKGGSPERVQDQMRKACGERLI